MPNLASHFRPCTKNRDFRVIPSIYFLIKKFNLKNAYVLFYFFKLFLKGKNIFFCAERIINLFPITNLALNDSKNKQKNKKF